jgi:hypothetical protein
MTGDRQDVRVKRENTLPFLRRVMDRDLELFDSAPWALDGLEARMAQIEQDEAAGGSTDP